MGKVLETFKQMSGPRPSRGDAPPSRPPEPPAVETAPDEEMPFIEVGGRRTGIEASPAVLAAPAGRPPLPRLAAPPVEEPAAGLTVQFRLLAAGLRPAAARFAPELVAFHRPDDPLSRQYQALAGSLLTALPAARSRLLLFTAGSPGAGTTTALLNLAITFARQGKQRVGVADANRQRPAVAERLGLPEVPGLAETLAGGAALAQVLQETGQPNLLALTAGGGNPALRFEGEALRALLRQLRERFDLVLIDAPCWPAQHGLLPFAAACDAVFLVSPEPDADTPDTTRLLQAMTQQGVPLRGHLLTAR